MQRISIQRNWDRSASTYISGMQANWASGILTMARKPRWNLGIRGGILGGARLLVAVEDYGAGSDERNRAGCKRNLVIAVGLLLR